MATDGSNLTATPNGSLSESGAMRVVTATREAVSRSWLHRLIRLTAFASVCGILLFAGSQLSGWLGDKQSPGVLPGEFEQQDAILFSWPPSLTDEESDTLAGIMAACAENVQVVVLVPNNGFRLHARQRLDDLGVSRDSIEFITMEIACPWARDFGPLIVKNFDGGFNVVDPVFIDPKRTVCEVVPRFVATHYSMQYEPVNLILPGGNIISNGAGVYVTTDKLLEENEQHFGHEKSDVDRILANRVGANELVYLTPLHGEFTGHVDMFATFTAPDTIVIGEYDPAIDSINAQILDENAKRLEGMPTAFGPLKVERIPMPARPKGFWWTYTNVLYANGVVVVPTFEGADPETEQKAIEVYQRLLRGWEVKTVESSSLFVKGGGPRCVSVNIYRTPTN